MCRQYSAETEKALKELAVFELAAEPPSGFEARAEARVLRAVRDDPYQLPCVRRAIDFYLRHHEKRVTEAQAHEQAE